MSNNDKNLSTDWDEYYSEPFPAAKLARQISSQRIRGLLTTFAQLERLKIAELGGGNSFIAGDIIGNLDVQEYQVVDSNQRSLELLSSRFNEYSCVTSKRADVLLLEEECRFDIVFSVGLIEHFSEKNTERAIQSHFHMCKPGGIVLLTFPTPTFLYRSIRGVAELLGIWKFPDERPLKSAEVLAGAGEKATLLHQSILWGIGLTQGYMVFRSIGSVR